VVGLVYAAELGRVSGRLDRPRPSVTTPCSPLSGCRWRTPPERGRSRAWTRRRAAQRFVVLDEPARSGTLADSSEELLAEAYRAVAS